MSKEYASCIFPECNNPIEGKNLCTNHYSGFYKRKRKGEDITIEDYIKKRYKKELDRKLKTCKYPNCDESPRTRGLCNKHYSAYMYYKKKQDKLTADEFIKMTEQPPKETTIEICVFPDCEEGQRTKGLCNNHYANFIYNKKGNKNLTVENYIKMKVELEEESKNDKCVRPDCDRPSRSKGLCNSHYVSYYKQRKRNKNLTVSEYIELNT